MAFFTILNLSFNLFIKIDSEINQKLYISFIIIAASLIIILFFFFPFGVIIKKESNIKISFLSERENIKSLFKKSNLIRFFFINLFILIEVFLFLQFVELWYPLFLELLIFKILKVMVWINAYFILIGLGLSFLIMIIRSDINDANQTRREELIKKFNKIDKNNQKNNIQNN